MPTLNNRLIIIGNYLLRSLLFTVLAMHHQACFAQQETSGTVSAISNEAFISIEGDKNNYELSDIYIPSPIPENTVLKMQELAVGKECTISYASPKPNRHGNFYTTLIPKGSNKSLQEILLENGLALVYFLDYPASYTNLFAAEAKARKAKLGIWKDKNSIAKNSNDITYTYKEHLSKFIIIEGVVTNIHTSKKNTYLNFGDNWKNDFSVQIENKTLKKFPGFAEGLKGKKVSVRGWLEDYNGPFMKIYQTGNIKILELSN